MQYVFIAHVYFTITMVRKRKYDNIFVQNLAKYLALNIVRPKQISLFKKIHC